MYQYIPPQPPVSSGKHLKLTAIGLLVAFVLTLATPVGLVYSCYIGWEKGKSLCAAPGCTAAATREVKYSRGTTRGYCEDHFEHAERSISSKQLQMPLALIVLGVLFIGHYIMAFRDAYTGKVTPPKQPSAKPGNPFRYFVLLSIAGIVGVNGVFWVAARYIC